MKRTGLLNLMTFVNKQTFITALIGVPIFVCAQQSQHLTLESLVHSAYEKYPYAKQLETTRQQKNESVKAINAQWLPQVTVSGRSTFQSEVSAITLPASVEEKFGFSLGEGEKLQYQGDLGVTQLIYDGGMSHAQKRINSINGEIQEHQVKSSMLQLEDIIDNLYEAILVNREQLGINCFQQTDLELRKKDLSIAISNGTALKTSVQEIDADIFQLKQQETELRMLLCQRFVQLSSYTQEQLDTTTVLEFPKPYETLERNFTERPDYQIYGKQLQSSDWELKKLNQQILPQISFFADGYYGRPGLNVMDFSSHYSGIIGVNMKWNIASLYNHTHQKKMVKLDKYQILNKKSIYEIEMNKQVDNLNIDLQKNKTLIENDDKIVKIRTDVKNVAAVQLKNGSITLTDYLIKLNDESQAMISRSIHRISFLMDGAKMRTLLNKNN